MIEIRSNIEVRVDGRIHPPHSLLGLVLRRRFGAGYRAETIYLVTSVMLVTGALVIGFVASSLGFGALAGPGVLLAFGLAIISFAGYRGRIEIVLTSERLRVNQGRVRLDVPFRAIRAVDVIDAVTYHRVEARRPGVHRFVNDYRDRLVRIQTDRATIVLGVPEEHAPAVLERLLLPSPESKHTRSLAEA